MELDAHLREERDRWRSTETAGLELIASRRELLRELISDYDALFDSHVELDFVARSLADLFLAYRLYIEERIQGVRSISGRLVPSIDALERELAWLFDPRARLDAGQSSWTGAATNIGSALWRLFWLALVLALQPLARRIVFVMAP